MQNFARIAKI